MKLLLVSATAAEIAPLRTTFQLKEGENVLDGGSIFVLLTGVGMVATAFAMGTHIRQQSFDLALNLGIAGSFDRNFALGDVVEVRTDCFSELGAESAEAFIPIDEMGFGSSKIVAADVPWSTGLPPVTGITVNRVHGHPRSIAAVEARLHPQVESMEGAAFLYACAHSGTKGLQVRAISNYVELRDKSKWDIPRAIKNLNIFGHDFIRRLGLVPRQ